MKEEILYEMKSAYRDPFAVHAFSFGSASKTVCILGS